MAEVFGASLAVHVWVFGALIVLWAAQLIAVFAPVRRRAKPHLAYFSRVRNILPLWYLALAILLFSGTLNITTGGAADAGVWVMVAAFVALIASGAVGFARLKKLRFGTLALADLRRFWLKKSAIDAAICAATLL